MIAGDDGQSRRNEGKVGIKFATFPGQFKGALPEKKERGIFRLTDENNTWRSWFSTLAEFKIFSRKMFTFKQTFISFYYGRSFFFSELPI